jgi:hypothetical protein
MTDGAGVPTGTPLTDPPLVEMISEDPVLRDTKLIAEAWDCDGLNQARWRLGSAICLERRFPDNGKRGPGAVDYGLAA